MTTYLEWGINPAVAGGLERLGWPADHALVASVMPSITRGTNTVIVLPPAPAWASPALGALLGCRTADSGRVLILAAPAMIAEWGAVLSRLVGDSELRIEAARGTARAARRLKADQVDVLALSPETALALHSRSSLDPERFSAITFAWPEDWEADEAIAVLLQDLPRDAQRIVFTSRPDQVEGMIDRYARKAVRVGAAPLNPAPAGPVRTLSSPWASRAAAVAELLEVIDPAQLSVWTADLRDHGLLRETLGGLGEGISLIARTIPSSGTVVCYDPPDLETLRSLIKACEVILLVPPGTEAHLSAIASPRHPVQVESPVTALLRHDAAMRGAITKRLEPIDQAALYLLAPLFERYDPQQVAAGIYCLWREAAAGQPATLPTMSAIPSTTPVGGYRNAKVWVGVGKKDDATVADLVAVLVREVGLDRALIGRIDLRDTFAIVEVPADDAERIAQRLVGLTIRRRKLSARVDTGRDNPRSEKREARGERPPRRS